MSIRSGRRVPPRLAAPLLPLLLIALVACGPTPASGTPGIAATASAPSPSGTAGPPPSAADPATVYAAIRSQVEAIRELRPTSDVPPVIIDEATLRANLQADFDRSNPPAAVDVSERELIALGLLPAGSSLRALVLDLESGQVAGYYSPHDKKLFVVSRSGGIGPTQESTYAHEFTHQLQDQHFDLDSLKLEATDQGDRSLARLCLVEGDAVVTQTAWMQAELSAADWGQVLADATDPAGLAALQRAPAFLRDTTLFPYQGGPTFVQALRASGGQAAVDAAFGRPPDSTEQILHTEKYAAQEAPVAVSLPSNLAHLLGSGWASVGKDTLGELSLRVWLGEGGLASEAASAAAAGWGGDRLELLDGPSGADALAIETSWDTPADAAAFATAATTALTGLHLQGRVIHLAGSSRVSLAITADASALVTLAGALPG